ncbi:SRPBCC domain-containing protein [Microbacterium dauci]|uniref:SRPBCC domain-containing protein n=1 Tax=Microbacterium dauci TaxID=3048008 RepID=A0ABT6ZED7_9MICO|nr:SRPBCC domain-containing protein [Microbacterium sp. LX3-4]MDJ1114513.1 SRPBCC domain-containing protein [Microbacterium sp. LX3-4]
MSLDSPVIEQHGDTFRMVYEEVYRTDIDDLWSAVTTPDRLARWMAEYSGDLRDGGSWEVASDGEIWGRGTVTSCDAPHAFTTTWHATGEQPTELVVRLEPAEGGTRLVLEHTGIQSIFYGAGWQTYLERLVTLLAGGEVGGEDAWQARYTELRPVYDTKFAAL